jgi:hypothetical protein
MMVERNLKKMLEVTVRDYELGLEWQPYKAFEFTATGYRRQNFEDSALKTTGNKEIY